MKKIAPLIILFLFALLVWDVFIHPGDLAFHWDGDDIDGPFDALLALALAGGGMVIAALALLFVGVVLSVVFAGVGIVLVGALTLAMVLVALAVSPLLLPVLIPVALIWFFAGRARRRRARANANINAPL